MDKAKLDLKNFDHQLIVAGMTNLVEKGMKPHDVFELLDDIKKQTWHGLSDIYHGRDDR